MVLYGRAEEDQLQINRNIPPGPILDTHTTTRNPSISNILRWVAGTNGQMNRRPSV